jgi:hypothetical protein
MLLAAGPAQALGPEASEDKAAQKADADEGPTLAEALEAGDLTTARELASQAREADPSPENWLAEATVLDQAGEYAAAADAYRGYLKALPEGTASTERANAQARLEELEAAARGTVSDEPESTHREQIDDDRAKREAANRPAPPPKPEAPRKREDRIIKKWYFWVTLAAIAGAAGAITGISIKAAAQEQKDDLDRQSRGPMLSPGGAVFRF